jgi:hypothetical protein
MNRREEPECRVVGYRLEIRDQATGQLLKVLIGDREANTITAEYPDGRKEIIGAFN